MLGAFRAKVASSYYNLARGFKKKQVKVIKLNDDTIVDHPITVYYPPNEKAGSFWLTNRDPPELD